MAKEELLKLLVMISKMCSREFVRFMHERASSSRERLQGTMV